MKKINWYKKFNKKTQEGKSQEEKNSIFIGAYLPDNFYDKYSHIYKLENDIHMTLLQIPFADDTEANRKKILDIVNDLSDKFPPIECGVVGICIMNNDNNTLILNIDAKGAEIFHVDLLKLFEKNGIEINRKHGFLPHVTLKYNGGMEVKKDFLKDYAWTIKNISVVFNKEEDMRYEFELKGNNKKKLAYKVVGNGLV